MLEFAILAFLGVWLALALRFCSRRSGGCPGCGGCGRECRGCRRTKRQ